MKPLEFTALLRTRSALNIREHWAVRARRVRGEHDAVTFGALAQLGSGWPARVTLPCVITLTRVGPRLLDTDAIPGAMKGVRDQLAALLGVTDGPTDLRTTWAYAQHRGAYAVEVRIEAAPAIPTEGP